MIGYRSIEHQGHASARAGKPDEANPYPRGMQAFYEYQDGCNAYRRGDVIDRQGNITAPHVETTRHASVHRQGSDW